MNIAVTRSVWRKIKKPSPQSTCVLCGRHIAGFGNNPWPLAEEGRCCNDCDDLKVIPARMVRLGFPEAHAKHTGELARNIRRKICQEKSQT
jgi:hypothetical protein